MLKTRGTGPKNFASTPAKAMVRRTSRVRASRASNPRVRLGRASAGYYGSPPGGAGGGIPKATSSLASAPRRTINKPKTGRPRRGMGKPRADFPSRI